MALRAAVGWGALVALLGVACGASSEGGGAVAGGAASVDGGAPASSTDAGASGEAPSPGGAANGGAAPVGEAGALGADGGAAAGASTQAPELTLSAVTISQTLEVPLMKDGAEIAATARRLPVIAGKRALVRAFVAVAPSFSERSLIGALDIKTGDATRTYVDTHLVTNSSTQDDLKSSFDFEVPAEDLSVAGSYRVRLLEADTTPLARFPESGYSALGARRLDPFELVLLPFVVGGFEPKTGPAELTALRDRLLALYPSSDLSVSVGPRRTLAQSVDADGDGWEAALDELYDLRSAAHAPHQVFYYGIMAPARSFDAFCPSGCVVGYSIVADATDVDARGAIGVGVFPDGSGAGDAWDTLAHELGHALGRDHAPCGITDPSDVDPNWPLDMAHQSAGLGVYGYDFARSRLIKPRQARDVMSYCQPVWISDYTYQGIFERLDYIQAHRLRALAATPPELFRLARIRRDGRASWLGDRVKNGAAASRELDLLDSGGQLVGRIRAQLARVDHGAGGYVWLPARALNESGAAGVDLRPLGGGVLSL